MGTAAPYRLFLDAGVVLEGCIVPWGASKAVLVLATLREHYTIVLAEAVEREIRQALVRLAGTANSEIDLVLRSYLGWLGRIRVERVLQPEPSVVARYLPIVLPVLRHRNDLDAVVSALDARADWVLSTNTAHWGPALATRTGLRIGTPRAFLEQLSTRLV